MSAWKDLADSVLDTLKEQSKELFEEGKQNLPFLKEIASQIAEHAWKSKFGPEDQREQHKEAILDLERAVKVRIRSESIRIKSEKQETFMTILTTVAKTALNIALRVVFPAAPPI